jgi:hypothetical protein
MKNIFKKFFSSTPIVLLAGLLFLILALYILFALLFTIGTYFEISLTIGFIAFNYILILKYKKTRKPNLEIYEWHDEKDKASIQGNIRIWNEEFRILYISSGVVTLLTVINFWTGILIAPIILLIYGFFLMSALYVMDKGKIDFEQLKISRTTLPSSIQGSQFPRTLVNYLIVLALIAGYWTFQIQKNESELKQDGYSTLAQLNNLTQCQYNVSKCIAVESFKSVKFERVKNTDGPGKIWQMCFSLNYKYEKYPGYFESDFRNDDYCFNEDRKYGYGWPNYEMEEEIKNRLKQNTNW